MTIDMTGKLLRPDGHHSIAPGFSVTGASPVIAFIEVFGLRMASAKH
jgi:hypothetical protein